MSGLPARGQAARMTNDGQRERRTRARHLRQHARPHRPDRRRASPSICARTTLEVDLLRVEDAGETDPRDYDLVVVGASIHVGHHQRAVVDWVKRHAATLNMTPSAFFSVSLTAAEDFERGARGRRAKLVNDFEQETGWSPQAARDVWPARCSTASTTSSRAWSCRMIARHHGQSTDTQQDIDYTDWQAVAGFAADAAALSPSRTHVGHVGAKV